jgi:hypothetical protein
LVRWRRTAAGPVVTTNGKGIAFTLASEVWTNNGTPILTRAHTEKVYAHRAVEALNPSVPAGMALGALRALLDAARVTRSDDLPTALVAANATVASGRD